MSRCHTPPLIRGAAGAVVVAPLLWVGMLPSPASADEAGALGISTPVTDVESSTSLWSEAHGWVDYDTTDDLGNVHVMLLVDVVPDGHGGHEALLRRESRPACSVTVALAPGQFTLAPDLSSASLTFPEAVTGPCADGTTQTFPARFDWTASDARNTTWISPTAPYGDSPDCQGYDLRESPEVSRVANVVAPRSDGLVLDGFGWTGYGFRSASSYDLPVTC